MYWQFLEKCQMNTILVQFIKIMKIDHAVSFENWNFTEDPK